MVLGCTLSSGFREAQERNQQSKSGLGAVCLQDGSPVAYASRVMTKTESRYAQIEKELLAAVFACTKFYDFTYGNKVVIETDHKPLITIVKKPLHIAPA